MDVSVTIRNDELKAEYAKNKDKIDQKIGKLNQFAEEIHNVKLVLDKSGVDTIAELSLHSRGKDFFSKAKTKNLKESFNSAVSKMQTQMKKEYGKYTARRHKESQ
ncbi:HPF/RaiA family ribosome-associated protein [candidate division WOR-3 bacterium]|nr:HPF/RaiA family ribosome-associated protein [candidate division WOR-3 bacterium]